MSDVQVVGTNDLKVDSQMHEESIFQSTSFKKYRLAFLVIGCGFFMGGSIALGVMGGVLAGLGTKLAMDRLQESCPGLFNWVLDNPGWVELFSMISMAGVFGLTLGGVFISLVANFTTSVVLDYYAEKVGKVPNVPKLSLSNLIKSMIVRFKSLFTTAKSSIKQGLHESKQMA